MKDDATRPAIAPRELLLSRTDIERRLGVSKEATNKAIERWKVKPVQSVPYGRGSMHFYAEGDLRPHLDAWFKAHPPKQVAPPAQPTTEVTLLALNAGFEDLTDAINATPMKVIEAFTAQHRILLDLLIKQGETLSKIVKDLGIKT